MTPVSKFPNDSLANGSFSTTKNYMQCLITKPYSFIYITFVITNIFLLLPLCVFILHRGVQQWLQKRSSASLSHSDCFTYHMVVIELIGVVGNIVTCCGVYGKDVDIVENGDIVFCFTLPGKMLIHSLTCVERYLAVVHPITYLSLRNEKGVRIRNISIGCAWLLCFIAVILYKSEQKFVIMEFLLLALSIIIISFCSLSVLCVLFHPGPGEQGAGRKRADQSKQRAFCTMVTILGTLVMRFTWGLNLSVLTVTTEKLSCVISVIEGWINIPSSLVLPLLYLHKERTLVCGRKNLH